MEPELINLSQCSIDTNVLLRWLLADNQSQASTVQKLLDQPTLKKVHITDIVIAESVWVMQSVYKLERSQIQEALEIILNYPKFNLNKILFIEVLKDYVTRTSVSFVDLMIASYGKLNNSAPVFTFDQKFAKNVEGVILLKD